MINFGFIACGDVAFRSYFPGMALLADRARVVACADPRTEQAQTAAALFPGARAYTSFEELLDHPELDVVVNLTPAPLHRDVTAAALESGRHVFSEKPLAATVEQGQELIALAKSKDKLLMCAPAVMATGRFLWLREVIASGRIGSPTLATAQMGNMGPAGWRGYTGDPRVFYGPGVGPLLDTGVYVLHAVTGLLGPARRVQAFGGISIPERKILIERFAGETIDVSVNDHMLIHLDFGNNTFAQILSSFAIPRSKAPALEVHGTNGTISINNRDWYDESGPTDFYLRDDTPVGVEGWLESVPPSHPSSYGHLLMAGLPHLVACLEDGAEPVLTGEHACHVLEIILGADRSVEEGRALELKTAF